MLADWKDQAGLWLTALFWFMAGSPCDSRSLRWFHLGQKWPANPKDGLKEWLQGLPSVCMKAVPSDDSLYCRS